jgi:hypothetical protein
MKLIFILILYFCYICFSHHLTFYQKNLINNILKNPQITYNQKIYIQNLLYNSYEKFAVKKAIEFKQFHKNKCANSDFGEIVLCSKYGLWKSILKFKGYTSLEKYSLIYIKSELNKYLTDKYSLSPISKKERIISKKNYTLSEINKYNHLLNTNILTWDWKFDKIYMSQINSNNKLNNMIIYNNYYKNVWFNINNTNLIDSIDKKILNLKYDFYFNKIRSNKKISDIIFYSEEYVRIKHNKSIDKIKIFLN